jgi:type 1 glutamine amidotransferase
MKRLVIAIPLVLLAALSFALNKARTPAEAEGPIRILFLGHDSEHHDSNKYFPMLSKALGRDGIYFDYYTDVEEALGDFSHLSKYDGVLLYANHGAISEKQYGNLKRYITEGGGFIPVHCASACFNNQPDFVRLVGGKFAHHKGRNLPRQWWRRSIQR